MAQKVGKATQKKEQATNKKEPAIVRLIKTVGKILIILLLLLFLLVFMRGCDPMFYSVFFLNRFKDEPALSIKPETRNIRNVSYIIHETDSMDNDKNFSGIVTVDIDSAIYSLGLPKRNTKDWRTDWEVQSQYMSKAEAEVHLERLGMALEPKKLEESGPAGTSMEFSLKGVKEGASFPVRYLGADGKVTLKGKGILKADYGDEGALIEIVPELTEEQKTAVARVEEVTKGTVMSGWARHATTFPSLELRIKKTAASE